MIFKGAKAATQSTELFDINCTTSEMAYERAQLKVSNLDGLKKADKQFLTKMTDLQVDLSNEDVKS